MYGLNWYDFGARYYSGIIPVFMSMDPLCEKYYSVSPYAYCKNNPINRVDPDGCSTHTDSLGVIIAVFPNSDKGVYKHNMSADEYDGFGLSANDGTKMGETEYWDEFIDPETGKAMTTTTIQFDKSFDPIIERTAKLAEGMDLTEIAAASHPGGVFDIKEKYINTGGLLNGKYVSARSAGNYLAGYNAANGTLFGVHISFETFQKLAGALHVLGDLTGKQMRDVVIKGTAYGPPPAYGERIYQQRMSHAGWQKAKTR